MSDLGKATKIIEDQKENVERFVVEGQKKMLKTRKKAQKIAKQFPKKAKSAYEKSLKESPSTSSLAKVGFWSGLASLPLGFPANAVALISAAAVEDRRRLANKSAIKKMFEKTTAPTKDDLVKSRIGAVAGTVSLLAGLITVGILLRKAARVEEIQIED